MLEIDRDEGNGNGTRFFMKMGSKGAMLAVIFCLRIFALTISRLRRWWMQTLHPGFEQNITRMESCERRVNLKLRVNLHFVHCLRTPKDYRKPTLLFVAVLELIPTDFPALRSQSFIL
eukprot:scaffold5901_cov116-Cylindrotheca_fusiformis.AAC.16